ncbi:RNA polymerase sigma factor [Streptomyces sp. NPDC001544]|uniref:RNA polymerase sigma factor n=1 Tax=Streptomyces sp. NPDC001544 TaxID=3364584 RepID=UPI0036C798FD
MTPAPRKRVRDKPFETWDDFFTASAEQLYRYARYLSYDGVEFNGESEMNLILARIKISWDTIDPSTAVAYARRALVNSRISRMRTFRPHTIPLQQMSPDGRGFSVDLPDPAPAPEELAVSDDLVERSLKVMDGLAPEHKEVLIMTYAGHTPKEIAALLRERPGTIRQRLHRARQEFDRACDSELRQSLTHKVTKGVR